MGRLGETARNGKEKWASRQSWGVSGEYPFDWKR
jgi:hypothetical protein